MPSHKTIRKSLLLLAIIIAIASLGAWLYWYFGPHEYRLSSAHSVIDSPSSIIARDIAFDAKKQVYTYTRSIANTVESKQANPAQVSATLPTNSAKGISVTDPIYKTTLTMTPCGNFTDGKQDSNRVIYPFRDHGGWLVYTANGTGIKEDIVLSQAAGDTYRADYQLQLPEATEARKEPDGSIGIYGNSVFLNTITAATDSDQLLLQKARTSAKKDLLLFTIPAPTARETGKQTSAVRTHYELSGTTLTILATGLAHAQFPVSIDPSIYIVTAQQFMSGNNETNIDFDVPDKLIRKAPTTGARFNSWSATTALAQPTWGGNTVIAGGYMYSLTPTGALYWAQISTTTGGLTSPNPGTGACSNWCTSSEYNLPKALTNTTMVTYNGFLYIIGGLSGTTPQATIYVAKIGSNGEPQLWNPTWNAATDPNKTTWSYWYTNNVPLTTARSGIGATAYNNRLYLTGGRSASATVSTVEIADMLPTGQVGTWTASTSLPYTLYNHSLLAYNDRLYIVGGNSTVSGTPLSSIYYTRINPTGTLNNWVQTNGFANGRMTGGGNFATVWGAYLYVSGGCGAVNASGYCTTVRSDTQLASINADGSLDTWDYVGGVTDQRFGQSLLAWRNYLYQVGGCTAQNTTTGACSTTTNSIVMGAINQDGDASTVGQTVASGTAPCSGATPTGCNLPGTTYIGNMLTISFISNGYLYLIGGCTNNTCSTTSNDIAYVAISSTGQMSAPSTCPSPRAIRGGMWCVDTTNTTPTNVAAGSPVVFNGRIYIVGGLDGTANTNDILRADINQSDGSLGTWTTQTMTGLGMTSVSYLYSFARANPAAAATNPGNLYVLGGCSSSSSAGCTAYSQNVYKCNIQIAGAIANCSRTNQLQIGTIPGDTASGLGIMSGTVYANYVYLIGGVSPNLVDLKTVRYAKIDNNNNIVTVGSGWIESPHQMAVGRRRSAAFGYNGYLYAVGGYEAVTGVLADIEYIKIDVSSGALVNGWSVSAVHINQRWGLTVPISNSYAYVIGGCTAGASPGGCTVRTDVVQTFQIYNNDSGTPAGFSTSANTYSSAPNRIGASATVLGGVLYVAGGCTGTSDCDGATNDISYTTIDPNGTLGSWQSTTATLPAARAWGKLLNAGGSLYYVGGQDSSGASQSTVYFATPAGGNVSAWSTAANGLPAGRTQFGAAVWNNRLYIVAGNTGTYNQVTYPTAGSASFTVPNGVNTITAKVWGAGGGGANGSGSSGTGGGGGGGGFAQSTLNVTPGTTLAITTGSGGIKATAASNGGSGGGFSAIQDGAAYLLQAGGGGGGGGANGTGNGGGGGAGGGTNGIAGSSGTGSATLGGNGSGGTASTGGGGGTAGSSGAAGYSGAQGLGGDAGGTGGSCIAAVTTRGSAGGVGGGGKGGLATACVNGGGGGGGNYGGGGGGSAINSANRGSGGGGGGSSFATGTAITQTAGSGQTPGNNTDPAIGTAGVGGNGSSTTTGSTAGSDGAVVITYGSYTPTNTVYVSPELKSGGDITSPWLSESTALPVARSGVAVTAYANNLYVFGGYDGTNYLSDSAYSQIDPSTGNAGAWTYSTSLPKAIAGADAVSANGYIYLVGGRNTAATCDPSTLLAPVSANTTIASGNLPTGIGEWSATNQRYTGSRYGAAAAYYDGKLYVLGGACGSMQLTYPAVVAQQTTLLSQPQVAKYSIMIDTDSDVFPNAWLLNGVDNSIGARWQLKYRSMSNQAVATKCATTTTWGQETNFGNVALGTPGLYTVLDGSGTNVSCGRYFYFNVTVDSSQAFGYPDDVSRGPTITDLTLQFTADASKRLMHGRTFINGLQMPNDTPYYSY